MKLSTHIPAFLLSLAAVLSAGCTKSAPEGMSEDDWYTRKYVNSFARGVIDTYYLWIDDVQDEFESWTASDEPISKVQSLRYKDSDGNEVDKWTRLTDDYDSFIGSVNGTGKTLGFDFNLYWANSQKTGIIAVVTYTYANSPARKAGLKRGDVITMVDGESIPVETYSTFLTEKFYNSQACTITLLDGSEVDLVAEDMYCDPIVLTKVFDCGSKKVGYIFYTSYTKDSKDSLKTAFAGLKEAGVSEVILDLRYNGGGYDIASKAMCSLIAPTEAVSGKKVMLKEVYNKQLSKAYGDNADSHFDDSYIEQNIDADKVYVIMTGNTASASEATICALSPYVDVVKIGQQSYGKYCGGYIIKGADWYENYKSQLTASNYKKGISYAGNWGIYVMVGRYADCNGETPCMPDGYTPDVTVTDEPLDGHEIGDPEETMLKVALKEAGYEFAGQATCTSTSSTRRMETKTPIAFERPACGIYLIR